MSTTPITPVATDEIVALLADALVNVRGFRITTEDALALVARIRADRAQLADLRAEVERYKEFFQHKQALLAEYINDPAQYAANGADLRAQLAKANDALKATRVFLATIDVEDGGLWTKATTDDGETIDVPDDERARQLLNAALDAAEGKGT